MISQRIHLTSASVLEKKFAAPSGLVDLITDRGNLGIDHSGVLWGVGQFLALPSHVLPPSGADDQQIQETFPVLLGVKL
jgi:hypothetical protein